VLQNTIGASMDVTTGLWTLFASSFLAATLLPGGSEAVLLAVLTANPDSAIAAAVAAATFGNTLGGLLSYLLGRLIPQTRPLKGLGAVQRYGAPLLLLSWVPFIGDALCVAAGWLRLNPAAAVVYMAIGKFARYALIAVGFVSFR
jgi:membrane protein YqaA with SNARE-associated domain